MKNKITKFVFFSLPLLGMVTVTGCGPSHYDDHTNIKYIEVDKVHVEYDNVTYIKDGNDIYAYSFVYSMSGRTEVYIRENLTEPAVEAGYDSQYYISARWNEYDNSWQLATEDTLQSSAYHANDMNHLAVYGTVDSTQGPYTSSYMFHGYSDVNIPYENPNVTVTRLENETIAVNENQNVECEVWDYIYSNTDSNLYVKERNYYAKDTHIALKQLTTFDRDFDLEAATITLKATYYAVGETMSYALNLRDRPVCNIPDIFK